MTLSQAPAKRRKKKVEWTISRAKTTRSFSHISRHQRFGRCFDVPPATLESPSLSSSSSSAQHHHQKKVLFFISFHCLVLCLARVYFADPRRHKGTKDFNEYNRNSHHENKREKHHKWLFTTENLVDGPFSSLEPKPGRFFSAELRFHHSNLSDHSGVKRQKHHTTKQKGMHKKVNKLCCLLLIYHDSAVRWSRMMFRSNSST